MDKKGEFLKRLLATFKVEAGEHVQVLSTGLIELEKTPTPAKRREIVETIFREAHSLKGAARAVNQHRIETLCQSLENVLSALKRNEIELSADLLDLLHEAVDTVTGLLRSQEQEKEALRPGEDPVPALCRRLDSGSKGADPRPQRVRMTAETQAVPGAYESFQAAPPEGLRLADTIRMPVARLDAVLLQVEELLSAKLTASQRAAEIREVVSAFAALKKERSKIAREVKAAQRSLERQKSERDAGKNGAEVRKLLEFMNWEGGFVKSFDSRLVVLAKMAEHDIRSLGGMVDNLLDDMKKVLMLPIASMLEVFPKVVRDLARDQGKEVDFVSEGGDIEIDRRILEEMRDPLTHLIRNCIHHGIEAPKDRKSNGKPARGTIAVSIAQKDAGRIELRVADDGAGIDIAQVRRAAEKLGVVSEDVKNGDEESVLPLIFQSGVSTTPILTDISGRGLGLAIVREKVEKLNGTISVDTRAGFGTTFRIVLPVTLATYRGIHVRVHGRQFIFPTAYVEQATKIRRDDIKTVENRETMVYQGKAVSLVRLVDVLQIPGAPAKRAPTETVPVIIVDAVSSRLAFSVDEVLYEQEVLVKGLGKQLYRVRNIAGATVLGTGKVVPILNVPDLVKSAARLSSAPGVAVPEIEETVAAQKSILVAEDSITSRMLLKGILESAGYQVTTAVDGIDAFTLLRTEHFDLVVSDVDMPRLSGFDLTARIRADKKLADLPVVLVTALKSQEHRERGVDVGANAYIVKSSFDQSNLLEAVRRLL